jgi:hypothetical protein
MTTLVHRCFMKHLHTLLQAAVTHRRHTPATTFTTTTLLVRCATRPSPPFGVEAHERPRPGLASPGALGRTAWRCHRLEPAAPALLSAHASMPGQVIGQIADYLIPEGLRSVWGTVSADTPGRPRSHDRPQTWREHGHDVVEAGGACRGLTRHEPSWENDGASSPSQWPCVDRRAVDTRPPLVTRGVRSRRRRRAYPFGGAVMKHNAVDGSTAPGRRLGAWARGTRLPIR